MSRLSPIRTLATIAVGAAFVVAAAVPAHAIDDHLRCYKIKDPLKLKGVVDIDTPQFGLAADCKISKAKLFCVPADKTAVDVEVDKLSTRRTRRPGRSSQTFSRT